MGKIDKLSGKGRKAFRKLEAIQKELRSIEDQLREARNILEKEASDFRESEDTGKDSDPKKTQYTEEGLPKRVKFESYGLKFYIDFTIAPSENSDPTNIQGIIVYGVRRTLCLPDLIMKGEELETKSLIQFSVNRHGMIQSSGAFEDTWWLKDEEKSLPDLHYRALDHIWGQALDWVNENIVP